MAEVCIGLGANLGDREATLRAALGRLAAHPQISVTRVSAFRRTCAVGGPPQADFANAAARLETSLSPSELLGVLQRVERDLGRRRARRWAPRCVDLDLLLYDDARVEADDLVVPHPLMHGRRFVLEPLCEVAAAWRHPVLGRTVSELRVELEQRLKDGPPQCDCVIAVAGPIASGKTTLALQLAARMQLMPLLEAGRRNPLLGAFYRERRRHALRTEIWFLLERATQLRETAGDRPRRIVTDYVFEKDRIFTDVNLTGSERRIYETARALVRPPGSPPQLIVYLRADPKALIERVHRRGRPSEATLTLDYLRAVCRGYEALLQAWGGGPVLPFDVTDPALDFKSRPGAFGRILREVVRHLPAERWCLGEQTAKERIGG